MSWSTSGSLTRCSHGSPADPPARLWADFRFRRTEASLSMRRLRKPRQVAMCALVMLILLGLALRVACMHGFWLPIRVVSGSMGDALPGQHHRYICADCGYAFRSDVRRSADTSLCPNCGTEGGATGAIVYQGRRVLIDHGPRLWRQPRRWELWAFQRPGEDGATYWSVKRVVGLPHERLAICDGDIFVDDRLLRKDLAELRSVAIPVHNDRHRAAAGRDTSSRWRADRERSGWREESMGYAYHPSVALADGAAAGGCGGAEILLDWMTYRHCGSDPRSGAGSDENPVLDQYAYNQSLTGELHVVPDLLFACEFAWDGRADQLGLRVSDGGEWFEVRLDWAASEIRLAREGRLCLRRSFSGPDSGRLELACCDRQVLLAIDGELVLRYPYQRPAGPLQPTSRPLAVGACRGGLRLRELQIFRDIYYLDPWGTNHLWRVAARLRADEYFVLGDNVPISDDSRYAFGLVNDARLLGLVLAPEVWAE